MKPRSIPNLSLDEAGPCVEVASCWRLDREEHWRYHVPSYHFLLIETGGLEGLTPGAKVRAEPRDLVCFAPAARNEYRTMGPTLFYQLGVQFTPWRRGQRGAWLQEIGPLPLHVVLGGLFPAARELFETVCIELPQPGVVHRLRVQAALYQLLALIAGVARKTSSFMPRLDAWERVRLRLASTPDRPVNIAALAREWDITAAHFSREFRRRFGVGPKAYHTEARVREAARRLRDPQCALKAVAYDLGFADPKSLSRAIHRHLGLHVPDLRHGPQDQFADAGKLYPMNCHILAPGRSKMAFDQEAACESLRP